MKGGFNIDWKKLSSNAISTGKAYADAAKRLYAAFSAKRSI